MNTIITLIPDKDLTSDESNLMSALNSGVVQLAGHQRPVFKFDPALNAGNLSLIQLLIQNPSMPVGYEFDQMVELDDNWRLSLNICLTMKFHTQPSDWNGDESRWNIIRITPKQTSELLAGVQHPLLSTRFQKYVNALAQSIKEQVKRIEAFAEQGLQTSAGYAGNPLLDDKVSSMNAATRTTHRLFCQRLVRPNIPAYQNFVLKYSR